MGGGNQGKARMEWNGNGKARPEWHRLHCTGLDWAGLNYINGIRVSARSHGVCRCACTCICCERFACAVLWLWL